MNTPINFFHLSANVCLKENAGFEKNICIYFNGMFILYGESKSKYAFHEALYLYIYTLKKKKRTGEN